MYKPLPPRPKKTDIVRSRNGCKGCRLRRTKCDEKKPTCGTCARLGGVCESVKPKFEFRLMTAPTSKPASTPARPQSCGLPPKTRTDRHRCSPLSSEVQIQSQRTPETSLIPNLNLIQSLQHSERDIFYSTYWEDHCLPALHPTFHSASRLIGDFPVLKDATLALSSCNLSRTNAERKSSTAISYMGAFRPNLTHQTRSQLYYSSAIKRFTQLSQQDCRYNVAIVLTILILFAHLESTMGNFEAFYCHVRGLTAFLDEELSKTTDDPFVKGLLTAWMQSQFLVWWARTYFSSLDVQRQQPAITLPRALQGSLETLHERRVAVLSILRESHRLNFGATLKHWSCAKPNESASEESHEVSEDAIIQYCRLLAEETEKLDKWLLHLPSSEKPFQSDSLEGDCYTDTLIKPLFFRTHDAALNYAYYVLSRILQCTGLLRFLETRDPQYLGRECYEEEPWVRLLLKIVKGTDMKTSLNRNTYTIGFSSLLLAALLRCQDLNLGIWIESWLQTLDDMQPTEEGSFPVYQALSVVRTINQQRMMGRDVFGVSQAVDDRGGTPKFSSYNSQMINTLLIHGKWRASGALFTDCISIDRVDILSQGLVFRT